ncbi:MAG TPA: isoleucine--tRNA ligase, partial [Actinobacteria bacterium]|nr:isoleucine--tRNA ligase [Actinomycetota bacterium]
ELSWPADLYLEGSDQHRGWFQSSLLTSVGIRSKAPYRQVLTHGFLVDGNGRKMSKSLGNVVNPLKVIEKSGADILRLWVCSADYSSDIAVSAEILARISEAYRRIRNTIRFMLGSLSDFDPIDDKVEYDDMEPIDKWALMKLHELIKKVGGAYDNYRLHLVFHSIYNFCAVDLSSFYLDVLKDTLYTFASDSKERRSAQTAIYEITASLIKIISPVLVFTAEEAWAYLPRRGESVSSVHLESMPEANDSYVNFETKDDWEKILLIRSEVSKATEEARAAKIIGSSLEARIGLFVTEELVNLVEAFKEMLPALFIVSQVEIFSNGVSAEGAWESQTMPGLSIEVTRARGKKCARCWNFRLDVGADEEHTQICGRCLEVISA